MNPIKSAFALAACSLCAAALADTPPASIPTAPGWTWGAVTPAENGLLEEAHAYGIIAQAPAGLAPGRYRLTVTARFNTPDSSKLVVALPAGKHDYQPEVRTESGYPADAPDQWKTLRYDFDVEAGIKDLVTLFFADYAHLEPPSRGAPTAGRIQVQAASLKVEKLPLAVGVSYACPLKIRYKPGESGVIDASLTNSAAQPQTVHVRPALVDENDHAAPGMVKTVVVPALSTLAVSLTFTAPRAQGGYEAEAQIISGGKVRDAKGDVFADTDNPFSFAIVGGGPNYLLSPSETSWAAAKMEQSSNWETYVKSNTNIIIRMRSLYATYSEYFAWAREDATLMTETSDDPYQGGQASWFTSRKLLMMTSKLLKAQGIATAAYVNVHPFGWSGFEVFRQNPEWFLYPSPGAPPLVRFNAAILDKYNHGTNPTGSDYPDISANYEAVSRATGMRYIDYHIKQIEDSAKEYGWEAYRYDAGPPPVKYFPLIKARLARMNPPVFIGSNQSIIDLGPVQTPAWNTYCRSGSLMMDEAIRSGVDDAANALHLWTGWEDYLRTGAELTRRNGGRYEFINAENGNWLATTRGYAIGGHPDSYTVYQNPYGTNERFMLHYGTLFWDLKSQLVPQARARQMIAVTSASPLWWDMSVNERILDLTHRQVIVPLINKPTGTTVNDTKIAAQASCVGVTFTPKVGETVAAFLYAPEPVAHRRSLPMTQLSGGRVSVIVPPFWAWTNVVFDCRKGLR